MDVDPRILEVLVRGSDAEKSTAMCASGCPMLNHDISFGNDVFKHVTHIRKSGSPHRGEWLEAFRRHLLSIEGKPCGKYLIYNIRIPLVLEFQTVATNDSLCFLLLMTWPASIFYKGEPCELPPNSFLPTDCGIVP